MKQIEDLLLRLEADTMLNTMRSIGNSIDLYSDRLMSATATVPKILALPLLTQDDADTFLRACLRLHIGIGLNEAAMAVPGFNEWQVLNWLQQPERQSLDRWPEVLGVFWDREQLGKRLKETQLDNPHCSLPDLVRSNVHMVLLALDAAAGAFRDNLKPFNDSVLATLEDLESSARFRGLFFHVGDGYLYAGSGRRDIVQENSWHYLWAKPDSKSSGFPYIDRMTTTHTWADTGSPHSPYGRNTTASRSTSASSGSSEQVSSHARRKGWPRSRRTRRTSAWPRRHPIESWSPFSDAFAVLAL